MGLLVGAAGCVTHHQGACSETPTTTIWTPLALFQKDAKRLPKVETCLKGGATLEGDALSDKTTPEQKENLLVRARKAYQQALQIEPENAEAIAGLARVYASLQEHDKAVATYDKALKRHPKNGKIWFEYGKFHCKQKQYDKAADAFRKARENDPENREYGRHLGLCLARAGRPQEAAQVLGKLHGEARAHYEVALMLKSLNKTDQAREYAQTALRHDPMLVPAQHLMGQLTPGAGPPVQNAYQPPPPVPAPGAPYASSYLPPPPPPVAPNTQFSGSYPPPAPAVPTTPNAGSPIPPAPVAPPFPSSPPATAPRAGLSFTE
jgi:Tfp pilus assembly protein PilF